MVFSVLDRPTSGTVKSMSMKLWQLKPADETSAVPGVLARKSVHKCGIMPRMFLPIVLVRRYLSPSGSLPSCLEGAVRLRSPDVLTLGSSRQANRPEEGKRFKRFSSSGVLSAWDRERTNFLSKPGRSNDFALSPPRKNPRHDLLEGIKRQGDLQVPARQLL